MNPGLQSRRIELLSDLKKEKKKKERKYLESTMNLDVEREA